MDHRWFSKLPKQEQDQRKKFVESNAIILDILREIVYNIRMESKVTSSDYDSPSWAYKQAHNNGFIEALERVEKLVAINQK